jgi:hypothetical protein
MGVLKISTLKNAERGQSLIEVGLTFGILILLVSGLFDLGRIWYVYLALEDAAGEGALYLSIDPYCEEATDVDYLGNPCSDPFNATYRIRNAVGGDVINWSRASFTVSLPEQVDDSGVPFRNVGEQVKVDIYYTLDLLTPVMPRFLGLNPIRMHATATQTIISERAN